MNCRKLYRDPTLVEQNRKRVRMDERVKHPIITLNRMKKAQLKRDKRKKQTQFLIVPE